MVPHPCTLANLHSTYANLHNNSWPDYHDDNITNDSVSDELNLMKHISYVYISPVIICIGIFGDLMSIIVLSHPFLRKSSVVYSYLLALAVTDLLAHFSVIPMILWILDFKMCFKIAAFYYAHFGFPLANAFMGASVWIVVFITLGQYIAVCHPFVQTFRSKRVCIVLTVLAYGLSFTLHIPWMWRKQVRRIPFSDQCPYMACDNVRVITAPWYQAYQWTRECISRFVPFIFIVYFNVRILCVYRRSKTHRLSVVGEHQKLNMKQKTEREEKRLWYLLLAVMTIFFVCTLPAGPLTILVTDRWDRNLSFQIIRSISNILEFTKFALNFYLYCMINPDIRRLFFKRILCHRTAMSATTAGGVSSNNTPGGVNLKPAILKESRTTLSAYLLIDDQINKKSISTPIGLPTVARKRSECPKWGDEQYTLNQYNKLNEFDRKVNRKNGDCSKNVKFKKFDFIDEIDDKDNKLDEKNVDQRGINEDMIKWDDDDDDEHGSIYGTVV